MNFSNKLKELRKQSGLSQEQLADKLTVSRQAITKWETGAGMPDIENLLAVATLFGVTLDELVREEGAASAAPEFFYESISECDISEAKRYDFRLGSAREVVLSVADNEKLRVRLASNTLKTLESDFKVRMDERDIDIRRAKTVSETQAKEDLHVFVSLPRRFLEHTEIEAVTESFSVAGFCGQTLEFDGKAERFTVEQCDAKIEITAATDMEIMYDRFSGGLELNLMSATAALRLPKGSAYSIRKKGRSNAINFAENTAPVAENAAAHEKNRIELKGFHSELVIHEK